MNASTEMSDAGSQPDEVHVEFTLALGEGKVHAEAIVPTAKVTLTQLLPVLQGLSSSIIGAVVGQVEEEGHAISCKAGCGACCRQLVPISLFEAEAMAEWIRSLSQEQQVGLQQRFDHALRTFASTGFLEQLDPAKLKDLSLEERKVMGQEYVRQGVACPFLQDESCSIHPNRPLICREYLVTSPAECCSHPTPETVKIVPMPVTLSSALYRAGRMLPGEVNGWIPLVFLMAWMKMGARPGDSFEAGGPKLLAAFLEQCGTA
ncbi:YkgJ family cysteine cluster protein [Granulicella paludicola]|uniref:YkgJ family cysteine cluster protein n=1 Tax=Granulicella paludicola TaxID=474951 RepID=UPI0021E03C06|nr:YkgJ family cysteine cluster protein [Granulicella paludicola]